MRGAKVNKEGVINLLSLRASGGKGWYSGDCPLCGKSGHLGVIFSGMPSFKCVKCLKKGTLVSLLKQIGRSDLYSIDQSLKPIAEMTIFPKKLINIDCTPKECPLPIEYTRISYSKYLHSRGFTEDQYELFGVATAKGDRRYGSDYILFTVFDSGRVVGYLGRSLWSKEKMDDFNRRMKESGRKIKHVKYKNSSGDFTKMLLGYDEIIEGETHTVIATEGLTDKANVDRSMGLYSSPDIKCVCTFGKDISPEQVAKLVKKKIKRFILFYDPDAITAIISSIKYTFTYFDSVEAVDIDPYSDEDAGDMTPDKIAEYLNKTIDAVAIKKMSINKNSIKRWRK